MKISLEPSLHLKKYPLPPPHKTPFIIVASHCKFQMHKHNVDICNSKRWEVRVSVRSVIVIVTQTLNDISGDSFCSTDVLILSLF